MRRFARGGKGRKRVRRTWTLPGAGVTMRAFPDPAGLRPRSPALSYRQGRFWQPDVTVATVVFRDGRLLVVEEEVGGRRVLNQPAGHLEPDEAIVDAAVRETLEETGWTVRLTAFVGAYQWQAPETGRSYLRLAFTAEPVTHHPDRPLDTGIVQAHWLTPSELRARAGEHRSPLVWRVVQDALDGRRLPLESVAAL